MTNNSRFYSELPVRDLSISKILIDKNLFAIFPHDWFVISTDLENSTGIINDGNHELVNLLATGSIIAALNIAFEHDVDIPFFFGGDGATMVVPEQISDKVFSALKEHQTNINRQHKLDFRVHRVSVADLHNEGKTLFIAKAKVNDLLNIPVFIGDGLQYAERLMKEVSSSVNAQVPSDSVLSLQGMQCRWNKINVSAPNTEVVSLLINASVPDQEHAILAQVMEILEETYGGLKSRNPISVDQLKLKSSISKLKLETIVKFAKSNHLRSLFQAVVTFLVKHFWAKSSKGKLYLGGLVDSSDTLVIDGRVNTVVAGTEQQRVKLIQQLTELETKGLILFGYHASETSIMSCYVRNMQEDHIHFVDGSGGGYTQAATMLKKKQR